MQYRKIEDVYYYDPDRGFYDPELDLWCEYEDMESI